MNRRLTWVWVCVVAGALLVAVPLAAAPVEQGTVISYDQITPQGHSWLGRLLDWAVELMPEASTDSPPEPPPEDESGAALDPDG